MPQQATEKGPLLERTSKRPVQCKTIQFPKDRWVGLFCAPPSQSAMTASLRAVTDQRIWVDSNRQSEMMQLAWNHIHDRTRGCTAVLFVGGCSITLVDLLKLFADDFDSWLWKSTKIIERISNTDFGLSFAHDRLIHFGSPLRNY